MTDPVGWTAAVVALLATLWLLLPPRRPRPATMLDPIAGTIAPRPWPWPATLAQATDPAGVSTSYLGALLRVARQRRRKASAPAAAPELTIDRATAADAEAIQQIADRWRLRERSQADLMDRGFLVADFSIDEYQHLVAASDYCFVARHDGTIVGFLLAYSQARLKDIDDTTAQWLGTRLDDFVVIKQVAVDPQHTGSGVGRRLYQFLIDHLRGQGIRLVAAVVDTPPNVRSQVFHRRLGFTEAFTYQHADGRTRRIWRYSTAKPAAEILNAQYEAAVRLYLHEDTLNWDKLRNYLYVTVATAAATGFVLSQPEGPVSGYHPTVVGIALTLVGAITSLGFAVALRSGVSYLAIRKDAVTELEDAYVGQDGVRVVSRLNRARPWLRRSPTTWVLRLTPAAGLVIWLTTLAYLTSLLARS